MLLNILENKLPVWRLRCLHSVKMCWDVSVFYENVYQIIFPTGSTQSKNTTAVYGRTIYSPCCFPQIVMTVFVYVLLSSEGAVPLCSINEIFPLCLSRLVRSGLRGLWFAVIHSYRWQAWTVYTENVFMLLWSVCLYRHANALIPCYVRLGRIINVKSV